MRTLYHTIGGAQPPFVAAVLGCCMVCRTLRSQVFKASMGALLGQSLLALELQHRACTCCHIIRHASSTPLDCCQHGARCPAGRQCVHSRRAVCRAIWVSPAPVHPHHFEWHRPAVCAGNLKTAQWAVSSCKSRAGAAGLCVCYAGAILQTLSLRAVFSGCAGSCCAGANETNW
jgi:hypothetical protein